jgi:transcription antitermination factor NusG
LQFSSNEDSCRGRVVRPIDSEDVLPDLLESLDMMLHPEKKPPIEEQFPIEPGREFAYCLQVQTSRQSVITTEAPNFFPCKAISPTIFKRFWSRSGIEIKERLLLPGYVFLFSSKPLDATKFSGISGVIRVLQYSYGDYALTADDERLARWLLKYDGYIGLSKAVNVGTRIVAKEGPLRDYIGVIRHIDKHRRNAGIEFDFGGMAMKMWLDFDWFDVDEGTRNELRRMLFVSRI